jgi:hypothetical protein
MPKQTPYTYTRDELGVKVATLATMLEKAEKAVLYLDATGEKELEVLYSGGYDRASQFLKSWTDAVADARDALHSRLMGINRNPESVPAVTDPPVESPKNHDLEPKPKKTRQRPKSQKPLISQ